MVLTREQFDWLVAGLPWQRLSAGASPIHHGGVMHEFKGRSKAKCPLEKVPLLARTRERKLPPCSTPRTPPHSMPQPATGRRCARASSATAQWPWPSSDVLYRMSADCRELRPLDGRGIVASTETGSLTWLQDYVHPEDQPQVMALIDEVIRTKSSFELEHRIRRADGSWVWMVARAVPLLDAQGEITEWFGSLSDVSVRKQADMALRESEQKYRQLFDTLQEGIWAIDQAADTTFVNPHMAHLLGYSVAEMQGRPIFSFMDEQGVEIAKRNLERRQQGIAEQHDFELRHKDGQRVFVTMKTSPLTDRDGNYSGALAAVIDISDRKQAEESLRQSQEQFHTMANAMPQLAWMARPDGFIHWYNRRWYEYTGTTPEQMEGWGWTSVHDPEVLPQVLERWKAAIATGEPFDMTFPLRGADGVFRPFLTRFVSQKDEQRRVLQWFGTNTDVTELKQAEEQLRTVHAPSLEREQ